MMRSSLIFFAGYIIGGIMFSMLGHCADVTPAKIKSSFNNETCEVLVLKTDRFTHKVLHCSSDWRDGGESMVLLESIPRLQHHGLQK